MAAGSVPFPDRDTVAGKLARLGEEDQAFLRLLLENPAQDEQVMEGVYRHLDLAAQAPFLNTLKLDRLGAWLGDTAPARLQMRLMEAAKSGQHPAYDAFRAGLARSGGLERAYPKV
ncbi:hypothetical protein [Ensifer soli]|uniref:hypothetical protein n=1 Tax=Ciceribacter sp. sgz301302 TaxID=3342379 RepID=UPI0035B8DD2B